MASVNILKLLYTKTADSEGVSTFGQLYFE